MGEKTLRREAGLDVVRAAAILSVMIIHTAANALTGTVGTSDWWGALAWGSLARPAVPLFFMCSGALMLCRDITPRRILTHNLPRIICAMLAWAFAYELVALRGAGFTLEGLWGAVKRTLLLQHEFHFYYLHILLLVYAFLPVARVFVRGASRREMEYLLLLWFATGILIPFLRNFPPLSLIYQFELWYKMNMAYSAIGYTLLGHYVRQYGGGVRRLWYHLAFWGGLAVTFGGCAFLSLRHGALSDIFLEGMSPGPMLMALGLFGLALGREAWPGPVARLTGQVAQSSFCTYLCHILLLRVLARVGISPDSSPCVLSIPFVSLLLLAGGWLLWQVLRRIPWVKSYLV